MAGAILVTVDEYTDIVMSNSVMPGLTYHVVRDKAAVIDPLKRLSITFDGHDLSDLITIEKIERSVASATRNRLIENDAMNGGIFIGSNREPKTITVHFNYVEENLTEMRRILARYLVGEKTGQLICSDEPDVYYEAKIDGEIKLNESKGYARGSMDFLVPDAVAYSIEPINRTFPPATSIFLNNNGSDYAYPTYDFTLKSDTYMVALSTAEATYQFGETLEQAPTKTVTYRLDEVPGYEPMIKRQVILDDKMNTVLPEGWAYFDISQIREDWSSTGGTYRVLQTTPIGPSQATVKVAQHALLWQTGERIADWVKGRTFTTDKVKTVNQSRSTKAYRLIDGNNYLGWLLEQDIEGQNEHNLGGLEALYGTPVPRKWYGPAIHKNIRGKATNWQIDVRSSFKLSKHAEYGMQYFAVLDGLNPLFTFEVTAHKINRTATIYLTARDKGLSFTQDTGNYFMKDFEGLITVNCIDDKLTLEIRNTISNKMISQTWTVPEIRGYAPTKVALFNSRYPDKPIPEKNYFSQIKYTGFNAVVWVDPDATVDVNEPDPIHVFKAGDQIRLDMNDNKAYVNGLEMLTPIAYGSSAARIAPGTHEVIITTESTGEQPDLEVNYREVYK